MTEYLSMHFEKTCCAVWSLSIIGTVVKSPLQTHVFVCFVYKGVVEKPSWTGAIHLPTSQLLAFKD